MYKRQGHDDDQTLRDVGIAGFHAHELQRNLEDLKHQHAHQDAADLAHAAVDGYAADGAAGDGLQLVALRRVDVYKRQIP